MLIEEIENIILSRYPGVKIKDAYAERSLFYNPENKLPNGVYFVTIKNKDGKNDASSNLNRENVYRVSFPLTPLSYKSIFGKKPSRPKKGETVDLEIDFTTLGKLIPHPIYAWMNFVCINKPESEVWEKEIIPLLDEAYKMVMQKFEKKTQ